MKVMLAGYNVDASVIEAAANAGIPRERLTPEVLSAAYARISRDPRPIFELRKAALEEVGKARLSNQKIIFEMGHHSVAEHSVFNFDILGISRLAIEWLERFRLCSYTEKSQRYITLDHDFTIPKELAGTPFESDLRALVSSQTKQYDALNQACRSRLGEVHPEMEAKKSGRRLLDNWSKEDARYVTMLATTGQLGLTANARNLELMIRRSGASPLAEVRNLGEQLHEFTSAVAPSLLLFTDRSTYEARTGGELEDLANTILGKVDGESEEAFDAVKLLSYTENADQTIAASLLHTFSSHSMETCRRAVADLSPEKLTEIYKTAMGRMEFFDATAREFEHALLTFEITLSSSAYAQLKRHRMSTQTLQDYHPGLGITIPPAIEEVGMADEFRSHTKKCEDLFFKIQETNPAVAPYVLTNAHRRRVLITLNLRELYHFTRLREDAHAQWDIRFISTAMREQAQAVMPLCATLLCGKDGYAARYESLMGRRPSILPPVN